MKNKCPSDEEMERTKEIIEVLIFRNGEDLAKLYLKNHVILRLCVFEEFIEVSFTEFDNNLPNCVPPPDCTRQVGLKHTDIILQTHQDKYMFLLLENIIRGGISSVLGDRYVKTDDNKSLMYIAAINLYGHSLSQILPNGEIKLDENVNWRIY